MLATLRIKNLALVTDRTVDFPPGLSVITGETGAGKSMLLGALNLVLGERADRDLIRSGTDHCTVEAVFDVQRVQAPLKSYLEENGLEPCEENRLVLKRSFSSAGANRQFINGSPASLLTLKTIGEWLVDIHGPHDHQSLLQCSRQLAILDAYGKLEPVRESFGRSLRDRAALEALRAALVVDEKTYAQQVDMLRFQVHEIASARLQPGEDDSLEGEYRRASHAARLLELCRQVLALLGEDENSMISQAGTVGRLLQELQSVDASGGALVQQQQQAVANLQDLQAEISRYADRVEIDPDRLRGLEERLNLLQGLRRKYGSSVAEILQFGEEARRKLESLDQRETELARLNSQIEQVTVEIWRQGLELSARRRKIIPSLSRAVMKQLAELGFAQSRFEISLTSLSKDNPAVQIPSSGLDSVEFQFAPNPGEPPRPLRTIASSGEMARVMLALKTVLAAEDNILALVFDEVDANVGGEIANVVGKKMRALARQRQVLCITHLPQVAASASAHFRVTKHTAAGRTTMDVTLLRAEERVSELARMLGGQTAAARAHAQALVQATALDKPDRATT